jgi:hemolysin activation/secretion protein
MCSSKKPSISCDAPPRRTLRPLLAALVIAGSPQVAQAAAAPDAGSILQQIQPVTPPAPSPRGTGLTVEGEAAARLPSSAPFEVKAIAISGNTLFDTSTLHALVADAEGKSLTLTQLGELAARITDYYRSHGYPLSRAIIPAQTIQSGIVRIEIIEARYGRIGLDNRSRVNDALLEATLSRLQSGQPVAQAELDRALLLLSDVPGIVTGATLKPGEAVGTSDLRLTVTPGSMISGYGIMDNYGNRYTGRVRVGATVHFSNPLHHGDLLSVSVLSSGSGMSYGRLGYESLLNGQGTRVGAAYSALRYTLGESLASLNAHGAAEVGSVWAKHPLVRSPDINLYGQVRYDRLQLRDHIDVSAIQTDRHLENWTASLSGDARDAFLSNAVSTWSVGWTSGRVAFDDEGARLADAATARTGRRFSKWTTNVSRLQSLGAKNTLYLAFSGQWANANLDSSEKMTAGGPYSVRAYDLGAVAGDTGYFGTAELRRDLGSALNGRWQAIAFVDTAKVTVNETPWGAGTNTATLSGAGVGLDWTGPSHWHARTYIAMRIGATPTLVARSESPRAWIEVSKGF